jgi:hypothetical protein
MARIAGRDGGRGIYIAKSISHRFISLKQAVSISLAVTD